MGKRTVLLSLGLVSFLLPALACGYVQADLERLLSTNECENCDLTRADLEGKILTKAKLDGVNLSGANLTNTILRMADLEEANFSNANLTYTVFEAADLYKANFEGANLDGTVFDGAYLVDAVFGGEKIVKDQGEGGLKIGLTPKTSTEKKEEKETLVLLETAQPKSPVPPKVAVVAPPVVESIDPNQSFRSLTMVPGGIVDPNRYAPDPALNITGFKPLPEDTKSEGDAKALFPLSKEDLIDLVDDTQMCAGCDFSGMDLVKVKLKGVYLEGVTFEGANLEGANLKSANLKGANLRNANLKGADLRNADLYKADLSGADLSGADLEDALIIGAELMGANLAGTVLSKETNGQ